ncbi:hypothetical protein L8N14_021445, partial [Serratia marcescens]|nr:hypothetical protein [Serratia marcescens]
MTSLINAMASFGPLAIRFGSFPAVIGVPGYAGVTLPHEAEPEMINCLVSLDEDVRAEEALLSLPLYAISDESMITVTEGTLALLKSAITEEVIVLPTADEESDIPIRQFSRSHEYWLADGARVFLSERLGPLGKMEISIPDDNLRRLRHAEAKLSRRKRRMIRALKTKHTPVSLKIKSADSKFKKVAGKIVTTSSPAANPARIPVNLTITKIRTLTAYAGSIRDDSLSPTGMEEASIARQQRLDRRNQIREEAAEAVRVAEEKARQAEELEQSDDDNDSEPVIQSQHTHLNSQIPTDAEANTATVQTLQRQISQLQESLARVTREAADKGNSPKSLVCEPPQTAQIP